MAKILSDAQKAELKKAGELYRRELLVMPLAKLAPVLEHMTLRTGVMGKEHVFEISEGAELRPYRTAKDAVTGLPEINKRTLETYLGDVVREFDPNALLGTIFSDRTSTPLTEREISRKMVMLMAMSVSSKFPQAIWNAKRNDSGDTTADLFDGLLTIINAEITAGEIADAHGNFADLGEINEANVVDKLMEAYNDAVSDELQEADGGVKLYLPRSIYNMYNRGYLNDFGSVSYNKEFKKTFLEGTDDTCELVPMLGLKGSNRLIFSTRANLLVGCDQQSDNETVQVRGSIDNPKEIQFFMMSWWGTQLESIRKQRLMVGKFTTAGVTE